MKYFYFTFILISIISCKNTEKDKITIKEIPAQYVLSSTTTAKENTLYVDNEKYSGLVYELFPGTTDTLLVESYFNGLKDGVSKKWYSENQLMEVRHYSSGQKNGKQIAYWENGNKRFEFTAKDDAYEGELKEWNVDGLLLHEANYKNGQEDGPQKLWYDNGKIRANYVIKNGKRFGLLGTKNCVNVSDSIFIDQ